MMTLLIPSHNVAQWLLNLARDICKIFHLEGSEIMENIMYILIIAVIAVATGYIIRLVVLTIARKIVKVRQTDFGVLLLKQRVLSKCSLIIPPLVFLVFIPFAFDDSSHFIRVVERLTVVYLLIMFAIGLCSVINFIWINYDRRLNRENHPLQGIANIAKGCVWAIIAIICVSIIINKSPMALLGGLGAFAAALMLIFKDSILGFVSGIQLSSNDMLRVGDWIVVPSTIANGTVESVSLTTVKVRNWDNTIVSVPPYTLVSSPFQNWRGMSESGVRQIERAIYIDNNSIVAADDAFLDRIQQEFPEMTGYISTRKAEIAKGVLNVYNGGVAPVNGTIDSNLGLFRAYMCIYLLADKNISNDNNIIVRLLNPDAYGTQLEFYCFTTTTDWLTYEAIRSELFEHIAVTAPKFGLRIFNMTDNGRVSIEGGKDEGGSPLGSDGGAKAVTDVGVAAQNGASGVAVDK